LYFMALDRWADVERFGEDALPVLTEALSDPSIEMRANAVKAIAWIGGEGAIIPLIRAIGDDATVIRMRAERALVDIGDEAIPALMEAIAGAPPEVREGLQRIIDEIRQ
ncbi:MAG: HEAT repeat domain-containing protein, partial [Methanomicrobiales archaeon]|nr:HEAT repeat domain-containing protein [Methanomicrobiales archaeon]